MEPSCQPLVVSNGGVLDILKAIRYVPVPELEYGVTFM
jgi:hypothetical protein